MRDGMCRACGRRASDGHHILLRSQGGDDHEDNYMPLCDPCHRAYHAQGWIQAVLTAAEYAYLVSKIGAEAAADYVNRKFRTEVRP